MDMFIAMAIVAGLGAVAALICGITSMAYDGEVAHHSSAEWMSLRVALQAAAFLFIVLAIVGTVGGPK